MTGARRGREELRSRASWRPPDAGLQGANPRRPGARYSPGEAVRVIWALLCQRLIAAIVFQMKCC